MFVFRMLVTVILSFITMLLLDKMICSKKFNDWYNKQCLKSLSKVPKEQLDSTMLWLSKHLKPSPDVEISGKEIISHLPIDLRYKINEKKLRAYMVKSGYKVLSDCFLDPVCFAVDFEKGKED